MTLIGIKASKSAGSVLLWDSDQIAHKRAHISGGLGARMPNPSLQGASSQKAPTHIVNVAEQDDGTMAGAGVPTLPIAHLGRSSGRS